ncbi:MAG: glycosyltransferase family 4 protein [Cyanobacteria bacterium]|nr:glycosyltransferase family 4 protein [Cyanobacteriota bacterium]
MAVCARSTRRMQAAAQQRPRQPERVQTSRRFHRLSSGRDELRLGPPRRKSLMRHDSRFCPPVQTALVDAERTPDPPASSTVRVGFTEAHGMAKEVARNPPEGIEFSFLRPLQRSRFNVIGSPIKGYFGHFEADDVDLIEAVMSPITTSSRWVCSLAHFAEACAFDLAGAPIPRSLRVAYVNRLFAKPNFKKLIFWSKAAHESLSSYGGIDPATLHGKDAVVYPAVRRIPDDLVRYGDREIRLFFSGDFFRKGGVNAVDAFERARQRYPGISLTVCCDERIDFNTADRSMRDEYLHKLQTMPGIVNKGRISREELMTEVYPDTDIFLMPTYIETFGMALVEAMAFGIPVISTNHFAIPEIIENGISGLLIDTTGFDCERLFRGYVVRELPRDFREYMTDAVFSHMCRLIESRELRQSIGRAGLDVARTKFSFERRNTTMAGIYRQAIADFQ